MKKKMRRNTMMIKKWLGKFNVWSLYYIRDCLVYIRIYIRSDSDMKTYRVKGYETVMYYVDIRAEK